MFNKFLIKIKNLVLIALLFYSSAIDCMQQGFTQEQLQSQEEANQEQSTNDNELANDGNDNSDDDNIVFNFGEQQTLQIAQEQIQTSNQNDTKINEETVSQTSNQTNQIQETVLKELTIAQRLAVLKSILRYKNHTRICPTCGRPGVICECDLGRIRNGEIMTCACPECKGTKHY